MSTPRCGFPIKAYNSYNNLLWLEKPGEIPAKKAENQPNFTYIKVCGFSEADMTAQFDHFSLIR
jgi:hypothetical protein